MKTDIVKSPDTFRVGQVAKMLGISRGTAYAAIRRGDIPSIKIGKLRLIPRVEIERLLQSHKEVTKI